MGTKKSSKSGKSKSKRLTVSKKTLRDLTSGKSNAGAVRGGVRRGGGGPFPETAIGCTKTCVVCF